MNYDPRFNPERFRFFLTWRKDYYYDPRAARRAVEFFHRRLKHGKGQFAGLPFILERWQQKVIRRIFGWKRRSDYTRKHRVVFFFTPRKQGKSHIGGGIGLYLIHADQEMGAEIVSAAADTDQANIIFSIAKDMNDQDPVLGQRGKTFKRSIVVYETGCSYKVISADAHTKHGGNLHGILFDELHAQPNRDLYDVLKTSTGARRQPLEFYATTAGFDKNSICYEMYQYAKQVRDGIVDDPGFLPVIYEAEQDDDWTKPETWFKANPNLGISVSVEYFEQQVREAKVKPAFENTFRRLHLNQWTEQDVRAINMHHWRECAKNQWSEEALAGQPCYLGLDMSSTTDLTAAGLVFQFEDLWHLVMRFWCPEEGIRERSRRDRVPYEQWAKQGFIKPTKGSRIDYPTIRQDINDLYSVFNIREICIDPWNAIQLGQQLANEDSFTVVQVRQTSGVLNAATKELLSAIGDHTIAHGGHPILTWNASNLSTEEDSAGNLKPSKKKSYEKIDGMVAVITGLTRALVAGNPESVYRQRGIQVW